MNKTVSRSFSPHPPQSTPNTFTHPFSVFYLPPLLMTPSTSFPHLPSTSLTSSHPSFPNLLFLLSPTSTTLPTWSMRAEMRPSWVVLMIQASTEDSSQDRTDWMRE